MPSSLPKNIREKFRLQMWKWYVVDARNLFRPEILRKHFDNKKQAEEFIERYCNSKYSVISWKKAMGYGIKDPPPRSKRKNGLSAKPKYKYPKGCKTEEQKHVFRNNERRRMRTDKERPKVTDKVVIEMIEDRPLLFAKRLSKWRNYHWSFSKPVWGFKQFKKDHGMDMVKITLLSNIVRCIDMHYNYGPYHRNELAEKILEMYPKKIAKWMKHDPVYGPRLQYVEAEFIARGFITSFEANMDEEDSYVASIHLGQIYIYPEVCYHKAEDKALYDYYIYDLQAMIGIPGYTCSHVAGLNKRK